MKRARRSYKGRHWVQMKCPECGNDLTRGSLDAHRQTQYCVAKGGPGQEVNRDGRGNNPRTKMMAFMEKAGLRPCPVMVVVDKWF